MGHAVTRRPDWEERLSAYIDKVRLRPHRFGVHDCVLFPVNAIRAMTGKDHAYGLRGRYRSQAAARRLMRDLGFTSITALASSRLGGPIPVSLAGRGDVVSYDGHLGICLGGFALFVGVDGSREGLVRIDRAQWDRAWSV